MLVKDAMAQPVETVSPDTSLLFVARRMKDADVGCLPVAEGGHLLGIVTDRDITCRGVAMSDNLGDFKARDVMTSTVLTCVDSDDLSEAVRTMVDKKVFHVPVIDRDKSVVGMLALPDIALKAPAQLSQALKPLMARDAARRRAEGSGSPVMHRAAKRHRGR